MVTGGRKITQNYCYYENHLSRVKTHRSKHLINSIHYTSDSGKYQYGMSNEPRHKSFPEKFLNFKLSCIHGNGSSDFLKSSSPLNVKQW
jgi:hypothetical protein